MVAKSSGTVSDGVLWFPRDEPSRGFMLADTLGHSVSGQEYHVCERASVVLAVSRADKKPASYTWKYMK